jgi:hypothetical protein
MTTEQAERLIAAVERMADAQEATNRLYVESQQQQIAIEAAALEVRQRREHREIMAVYRGDEDDPA